MTINIQLLLFLFSAQFLTISSVYQDFYKALYSDSLATIDVALDKLENEKKSSNKDAFKGALLMKKSEFQKTAAQKVELFKEGHQLLEAAITQAPQNAEYRFIRLTIQEHAPKILKYNKNITEDKALVIAAYKKLSSQTQSYILDYAQQSTILKKEDLPL